MGCPFDWIKSIFGWITNVIKNIAKSVINVLKNIIVDLAKWVKGVGERFAKFFEEIGEAVWHIVTLQFSALLDDLLNWIRIPLEAIADLGKTVFNILDDVTFGLFSKVWGFLSKIIGFIIILVAIATGQVELALVSITLIILKYTEAVTDPLILLLIGVTEYIVLGYSNISDKLSKLVNEVGNHINVYLGDAWKKIEGLGEWLDDYLKAVTDNILRKIGDWLDMTEEEIWGLVNSIGSNVSNVMGTVLDTLREVSAWVTNTVRPIWDVVKNAALDSWNYITNTIRPFWSKVKDVVNYVYSWSERITEAAWKTVKTSATRAWNWIQDQLIPIWGKMKETINQVWTWAEGITKVVWDTVKSSAVNAWDYITSTIRPVWDTIKDQATSAYNYIEKTLRPVFETVKEYSFKAYNYIEDIIKPVWGPIKDTIRDINNWYINEIKPYVDKGVDIIHKVMVASKVVAAIREGKVTKALLEGIGILGGEIEKLSKEILKFYDGTITSVIKGIGYAIGSVRKTILDLYTSIKTAAKDVSEIGLNVAWEGLTEVGKKVEDIAKLTLGKAYIRLGGIDRTVKEWISYLKEPVTRAISIISQTHADFNKYLSQYRRAFLRQESTITRIPYYKLDFPRVVYRGVLIGR